jgi:hypothetical protein
MADPHNPKRYGETWPQDRIDACLVELTEIRSRVILSGGWAWHFMSPKGHKELKHAHDHKDIDIFVRPGNVGTVIPLLEQRGFVKVPTKYDRLKGNNDFRRYEKVVRGHRVTIDFFVDGKIPERWIGEWCVVEPKKLLSLYKSVHSSDNCFAVKAATELLARNIDPVGHEELVQIPQK